MIGKKINQLATELAPESTDLTIIGDPTTGVSKKITIAQLGAIFSGAVSFYNDLASFPATGDINVIYCAKDTKKLYLWTGSAYVEVFPSQALLDTYQLRSEKGNANGYASLDSQGKVPISQLPSSIMEYKGTWNAATNTPTLANGTGDTGDVYICNVAGTVNFGAGPITFAVGDYVIYSGTIWQRSSGAVGTVTSVAASITGDSVTISGSPVTTSGTLAFAFAGTGAQYIKGDGTLATFPTTIDQAKNLITEIYNNTGATLTKGTIVYITGGQGNLPTVSKALATSDATSAQTYGVVQSDITNMNNGFVVVAGRLSDIDTQAYANGTQLYLSPTTAGTWTSTKPTAPNHMVYVGIIVRSHPTQGVVEIKIQNGLELIELADVSALTPTNNDGLFYESSTSLWKNKSIATVLGYTPANAATYVPYTGATANVDLGAFDLLSRSAYLEGTASYQAGLLIKQRGLYNFVTGAYTQIVADSATDLNIVHNQANTTRRRYALSVAALQDGDTFQYLLPRANGTIALTSDLTGGTVTSVAALTIGTSGTDLSSTVANGTTTPVITLNVPTASATNRGALSSADWTTFNNKQNVLTNPVTGTGTTNYIPKFTGTSAIGDSAIYDNSGNIGIGTTAANTLLSLVGNHAGGQSILKIQSSTAYSSSGLSSIGFNDSDGSRKSIIYTNTNGLQLETNTATPIIFNPNGTTALTLANGGAATFTSLVTISSDSGGSALRLIGRAAADASAIRFFANNNSTQNARIESNSSEFEINSISSLPIIFRTADTTRLTIASTGAATFSSSVTASGAKSQFIASGVSAGAGIALNTNLSGSNRRNWFIGTEENIEGDFVIKCSTAAGGSGNAGDTRFAILNNGNVGIGLTNPQSQLHINGDLTFTEAGYDTVRKHQILHGHSDGNSANNNIRFLVSDGSGTTAERMRINGLGNVGIGTTSPDQKLTIQAQGTSSGLISFKSSAGITTSFVGVPNANGDVISGSTTADLCFRNETGNMLFQTYGSERMRITSAGSVGIGTTSPGSYALATEYGGSAAAVISIKNSSASGYSGAHFLNNSGSLMGHFGYANASTGGLTDLVYFGSIANKSVVFTTNDTERMRITSGGNVLIGRTTDSGQKLQVEGGIQSLGTSGSGVFFQDRAGTAITGFYTSGAMNVYTTAVGTVGTFSMTTGVYTPLSDKNKKKDFEVSTLGLNAIMGLKPTLYRMKSENGTEKHLGFIAQEVKEYLPQAYVENDNFIGLSEIPIVAALVKAIQEQQLQIEQLKNK